MKRIWMSALSVLLVAGVIGLTGCDGGGVDQGMPDPNAAPSVPPTQLKDMADMSKGKTPPPSVKKIPEKGPDNTSAAEKTEPPK
jgi:hypothetical protein